MNKYSKAYNLITGKTIIRTDQARNYLMNICQVLQESGIYDEYILRKCLDSNNMKISYDKRLWD